VTARAAFPLLVAAQAAHSVEEWWFRLWEVLPPARAVSRLLSADLPTGFAIANAGIVAFGLWCWLARVRPGRPSARTWMVGWAAVEAANGTGHLLLALLRGGYFPGAYTAPLLLAAAAAVLAGLRRDAAA